MHWRRWWAIVPALTVAGLITWLVCRDVPEPPPSSPASLDASVIEPDAGDLPPSAQILEGGGVAKPPPGRGLIGYGRAYRSFLTGALNASGRVEHVIAIRDLGSDLAAQLDVLSTAGAARPIALTKSSTAQVRSVKVSSRAPEAVSWVEGADKARLGTLMYADLSKKDPVAVKVPNGDHAPEDGIVLGANGHQLLLHSQYTDATAGKLYWWSGTGEPKLVGDKAPTIATLMSADGSLAIVGVGLDKSTGLGDVLAVEMATGAVTTVAQHVALIAAAYESTDHLFALAREPAFSMSRNGRYVACAGAGGAITLWTRGKGTTSIGEGGRFPSPSEEGNSVAYYSGTRLVVWTAGTSTAFSAAGAFTPVWSPDSLFVAFLTKYTMKGSHLLAEDIRGDVSVFQLGDSLPTRWARDAAWATVRFGPAAGETRTLTVFGRLPERGEKEPRDDALGDVVVGDPADEPEGVVSGIRQDSYRVLPRSRGVAVVEPTQARTTHAVSVWTPGAGVRPDVVASALDSTLQVADFAQAGHAPPPFADDALVLSDPSGTSFGGSYVVASLTGFTPGGSHFRIKEGVLAASFARDGRVIVLTQEEGSDTNADVWILPFAPSPQESKTPK